MKTYAYKRGYTRAAFIREHTWIGSATEFRPASLLGSAWKAFQAGCDWIEGFERGGPNGTDIVITATVQGEGIHHRILLRRTDLEAMLSLLENRETAERDGHG